MEWILLLVGLFVGGAASESLEGALFGAALAFTVGLFIARNRLGRKVDELSAKLADFQRRFDVGTNAIVERLVALERGRQGQEENAAPAAPLAADTAPVAGMREQPVMEAAVEDEALIEDEAPEVVPVEEEPTVPPMVAPELAVRPKFQPPPPRTPGLFDRVFSAARDWLLGGNPVLRVGVVLLFLGLAFLLKYAAERVSVSVEMRYVGVAFSALVLLALGWRLRTRQGSYGLILQGTGIAVLYLTVFAAMYLHPLLSPPAAFALLVVVTVCSATLAVVQDTRALAMVATLGGLATPLLTTVEDSLPLFSYLLLLNLGLFGIAWNKAWRSLNLAGFIGTFALGLTWGVRFYTPAQYAVSEAFLVAFFLLYVAIGLLFARRKLAEAALGPDGAGRRELLHWAARQADYVHGTILFGPPIVGFGLQYALVAHMEFGAAFSALALGLFYLLLAKAMQQRVGERGLLLFEIYLALGVIFGTLAIPLALDAQWTAAAWAVEGAGIYWLGLRQRRDLARAFALLLQAGAAFSYLGTLGRGAATLLDGPWLGALLVGAALLFSHRQLRRSTDEIFERPAAPALALGGLAFLYLLPPLFFASDGTAASWAIAGLATLYAGLRVRSLSYLAGAVAIQLLGGALFLLHIQPADAAGVVLDAGWRGMAFAAMIGFALIAGMALAVRDPWIRGNTALTHGASVLLLAGLLLINIAVLFVLPWHTASGVWGGTGLLIVWLALQLRQRAGFYFGLLLQLAGGYAFFHHSGFGRLYGFDADLVPLAHSGFWTPAIIALAAFAGAWRLRRAAEREDGFALGAAGMALLSTLSLWWGGVWWALAAWSEIERFVPSGMQAHAEALAAAVSVGLWTLLARRLQWHALAAMCLTLAPIGVLLLLAAWSSYYHPAAHLGYLAWPALFAAHLFALRRLEALLPARGRSVAHVVGAWLILAVLSLELRYLLIELSEQYNAWRWLGWALLPSVYLLAMAHARRLPWPVAAYGREYRAVAALPVAALLLLWVWLAAVQSNGAAQPLPYVPLLNPLELSMLVVLFALHQWLQLRFDAVGLKWALPGWAREALIGASLFAAITTGVFRAAHHWGGVPFALAPLLDSMLVQAALSLVWTSLALALMVFGHRLGRREMWIGGAALVGVVVVKLFLVELGGHGSLERILSFIGVGVLLLIVGYFAPLPPRRSAEATAEVAS
jgi:uncharacterized membrane protein